jgi:hypothetical protein
MGEKVAEDHASFPYGEAFGDHIPTDPASLRDLQSPVTFDTAMDIALFFNPEIPTADNVTVDVAVGGERVVAIHQVEDVLIQVHRFEFVYDGVTQLHFLLLCRHMDGSDSVIGIEAMELSPLFHDDQMGRGEVDVAATEHQFVGSIDPVVYLSILLQDNPFLGAECMEMLLLQIDTVGSIEDCSTFPWRTPMVDPFGNIPDDRTGRTEVAWTDQWVALPTLGGDNVEMLFRCGTESFVEFLRKETWILCKVQIHSKGRNFVEMSEGRQHGNGGKKDPKEKEKNDRQGQ